MNFPNVFEILVALFCFLTLSTFSFKLMNQNQKLSGLANNILEKPNSIENSLLHENYNNITMNRTTQEDIYHATQYHKKQDKDNKHSKDLKKVKTTFFKKKRDLSNIIDNNNRMEVLEGIKNDANTFNKKKKKENNSKENDTFDPIPSSTKMYSDVNLDQLDLDNYAEHIENTTNLFNGLFPMSFQKNKEKVRYTREANFLINFESFINASSLSSKDIEFVNLISSKIENKKALTYNELLIFKMLVVKDIILSEELENEKNARFCLLEQFLQSYLFKIENKINFVKAGFCSHAYTDKYKRSVDKYFSLNNLMNYSKDLDGIDNIDDYFKKNIDKPIFIITLQNTIRKLSNNAEMVEKIYEVLYDFFMNIVITDSNYIISVDFEEEIEDIPFENNNDFLSTVNFPNYLFRCDPNEKLLIFKKDISTLQEKVFDNMQLFINEEKSKNEIRDIILNIGCIFEKMNEDPWKLLYDLKLFNNIDMKLLTNFCDIQVQISKGNETIEIKELFDALYEKINEEHLAKDYIERLSNSNIEINECKNQVLGHSPNTASLVNFQFLMFLLILCVFITGLNH